MEIDLEHLKFAISEIYILIESEDVVKYVIYRLKVKIIYNNAVMHAGR